MEKVSKIQIGCSKYDIQDKEARLLIQELKNSDVLRNIDINATVDSNTGTPRVFVVKGENHFDLNFTGLKGETGPKGDKGDRGDRGEQGPAGNDGRDGRDGTVGLDGAPGITPSLRATAAIGNTVGTPNVEVRRSGTDANPVFEFIFNGLRGKDGNDGTGSNYDDTTIKNRIKAVEDDLADKWSQIDGKVSNNVDRITSDASWLLQIAGKILVQSNFGESDVDSYLQNIGLYTKSGDTRTWAWSSIQQEVNNLWIAVHAIESGVDSTDLTALEASLQQYVDTKTQTAFNNLHTQYARKDAEKIIEWMYSELDQGAGPEQTWNDLVSAAGGNGSGAIANVSTNIKKLANNEYLATANLVSEITANKAGIATALASAGVLTSADLDNANSTLYSKLGLKYAAVNTVVTKDSSGKIQSGVTINADLINLQGHVWADDINASSVTVSQGLSSLSNGKVSVTQNGIVVTNGSTNTATIMPGLIQFGSSGVGTNYISNGALTIGRMQYSVGNDILQVGSVETRLQVITDKIASVNGDSASILLHSSELGHGGVVTVNAESTISLVSPNVVCSGGRLTLAADGESVTLTKDMLKQLILMLNNQ